MSLENGGDRPSGAGFDREHLHLRPVVRELTTAIEANNVCPGYGGRGSAVAQFAANGNGETATFVPTTEDPVSRQLEPAPDHWQISNL